MSQELAQCAVLKTPYLTKMKCAQRDSNSQPFVPKTNALSN